RGLQPADVLRRAAQPPARAAAHARRQVRDGPLARGARALPRPPARDLRAVAAGGGEDGRRAHQGGLEGRGARVAAGRGHRPPQARLPRAAAGVAARRARDLGRGPLAPLGAAPARHLRLRLHPRTVAAPPRRAGRPLLRPLVPDQPLRLVRPLVRRMKKGTRVVLYVMDTLGVSGRTKGIIDLALHLDPARYRPAFCSLGAESSALADRLRERSVPIEFVPTPPGLRPEAVWKLGALIRRLHVDVVHAINPRPLLYAGLVARVLGIRSTIGSLSAFACQVPDREYKFLPNQLVNRGRRNALRNQVACGLMRHVVAVSDELGERFCRFTTAGPLSVLSYEKLRSRMRAISYGIDVGPYERVTGDEIAALRAELGAGADTVLIGSVGRLVEQKDYPTQLAAFAIAARAEPRL